MAHETDAGFGTMLCRVGWEVPTPPLEGAVAVDREFSLLLLFTLGLVVGSHCGIRSLMRLGPRDRLVQRFALLSGSLTMTAGRFKGVGAILHVLAPF